MANLAQMTRAEKEEYYFLLREREARNPRTTFEQYARATVNFEPHEWQVKVLFPMLERFRREQGLRILMHAPPQYGKTVFSSQRLPAWLIGTDPLRRVVLATYNITRSAEFGAVVRDLMQTDEYREMFPRAAIPAQCSAERFATYARRELKDGQPSFEAIGLQTGFVGRGLKAGDTLIIDDPYASPEQANSSTINETTDRFWTQTAITRVDTKANVLCFFHSYHSDDFQARRKKEGIWEVVRCPAVADGLADDPTGRQVGELLSPIRTREYLEAIEANDPALYWSQFQGRPINVVNSLFDPEAWAYTEALPTTPRIWVRYWDLAVGVKKQNDYTVGALLGVSKTGDLYIADIKRFREKWPVARSIIKRTASEDQEMLNRLYADARQPKPLYMPAVEKAGQQLGFIDDLNSEGGLWFAEDAVKGDPRERASIWAWRQNAGQVVLLKAAWNSPFIEETKVFVGDGLVHDDQVSAVSGGFGILYRTAQKEPDKPARAPMGTVEYYLEQARNKETGRTDRYGSN